MVGVVVAPARCSGPLSTPIMSVAASIRAASTSASPGPVGGRRGALMPLQREGVIVGRALHRVALEYGGAATKAAIRRVLAAQRGHIDVPLGVVVLQVFQDDG